MFPKQPSVYREPASARPCRARANVQRLCRTPCKPHVSRGPFASETRTPFLALTVGDVGDGVMFQWNTRIATVFIVSAAMATTAAAQPQHKQGGGAPAARPAPAAPAPHPAPAPHAAPAPRAAPQAAAPRAAPHIAAPRAAPQAGGPRTAQTPRAAPQQSARPSGGPPASAMARHAPTPRTSAAPAQQQPQVTRRNAGGQAGSTVAQPGPRGNLARQAPAAGSAAAAQSARFG